MYQMRAGHMGLFMFSALSQLQSSPNLAIITARSSDVGKLRGTRAWQAVSYNHPAESGGRGAHPAKLGYLQAKLSHPDLRLILA
jgi:hypothetical protein